MVRPIDAVGDRVDIPHRGQLAAARLRAFSLLPAEQAGLMTPHVHAVSRSGLVLRPDDLAVRPNVEFGPDRFEHGLMPARVPAIPRRVFGQRVADRGVDETSVQLWLLALRIPVITFSLGWYLLGLTVRTAVPDHVRWVCRKEGGPLPARFSDEPLNTCTLRAVAAEQVVRAG